MMLINYEAAGSWISFQHFDRITDVIQWKLLSEKFRLSPPVKEKRDWYSRCKVIRWNSWVCLCLHSQRTQRYWSTSIHGWRQKTQPGHAFQSASAPAHKLNPRDFPFQKGRKRGYNITSFTLRDWPVRVTRVEGLLSFTLENISWFRFHRKSELSVALCKQRKEENQVWWRLLKKSQFVTIHSYSCF